MLFKTLVCAAMATSAIAAPLNQHQHHQHQAREVVVTQTTVVVVGGGAAPTQVAAPPSPVSPAAPASVAASQPQGSSASASAPASASSGGVAPPTSSGGSFVAGAKAITYSPYDTNGCKSSSQIASEIQKLSGYEVIRIYATDCNQAAAVLAAKAPGQKIFAGVFDVSQIQQTVSALASAVEQHGSWDDIYTVSIGNELVNSGQASVSQIGEYVAAGRAALKAAGYNGPVVSVDTFIAVINNPGLCQYSDYIAVNAHAFFDGNVAAENAGEWVLQQLQRVASACGDNKSVFITETGWPSQGSNNGAAYASESNQQAAIASIKSSCGNDVTLFTAFNDLWKAPGAFNAEQWWGIYGTSS